jgi:hypothetical protein
LHQSRSIERARGLEDDTEASTVVVERFDAVGETLVVAAVTSIFLGILEEDTVKLPDVVLAEGDLPIRLEDHLHQFGVTSDLLLVPRPERPDVQT